MTWRATTATGLVSLPIVEQDDPAPGAHDQSGGTDQ
jgi:hypothetical protein